MAQYELSEREKQSRAQADRLNAILSQSSIKEASESAFIRGREQALERQLASKNAQGMAERTGAQQFSANQNQLNRDAAMARTQELTAGQQKSISDSLNSLGNIDTAQTAGQAVINEGGDFKGFPDWVIGAMRGAGLNTVPNIVAEVVYSPGEKEARGKIVDATEGIRRALAGANLTGVEIGLQSDSAPDAPGIGMEESLRRLAVWDEKARRAITNITGAQPAGSVPGTTPTNVVDFGDL